MNSPSATSGSCISDLPNVSIVLGEELSRVGIHSADDLKRATAFGAWHRLHVAGMRRDVLVLLALEGAIQGVPWRSLPPLQRQTLTRLANAVNDGTRA
jgi:hypothetical protein